VVARKAVEKPPGAPSAGMVEKFWGWEKDQVAPAARSVWAEAREANRRKQSNETNPGVIDSKGPVNFSAAHGEFRQEGGTF